MADILIKNMGMPKTCAWRENKGGCLHNCFLYYYCHAHSVYTYKENDKRPSNCPLVEVPPHGRLIDADDLANGYADLEADNGEYTEDAGETLRTIQNAPTVLEAST